jgi:hypothetical protein
MTLTWALILLSSSTAILLVPRTPPSTSSCMLGIFPVTSRWWRGTGEWRGSGGEVSDGWDMHAAETLGGL